MPLIQCHIKPGLSSEQKRELMRDLAEATHLTLGAHPRIVTVIIHEHHESNIKELDYALPQRENGGPGS